MTRLVGAYINPPGFFSMKRLGAQILFILDGTLRFLTDILSPVTIYRSGYKHTLRNKVSRLRKKHNNTKTTTDSSLFRPNGRQTNFTIDPSLKRPKVKFITREKLLFFCSATTVGPFAQMVTSCKGCIEMMASGFTTSRKVVAVNPEIYRIATFAATRRMQLVDLSTG